MKNLFFGTAFLLVVIAVLFVGAMWYTSAPIVQKETASGRVVSVITADGVKHPPSYFKKVKDGPYDVVRVGPKD